MIQNYKMMQKGPWKCEKCHEVLSKELNYFDAYLENTGINKQKIRVYGPVIFSADCRKCGYKNEFWTLDYTNKAIRKVLSENVLTDEGMKFIPEDVVRPIPFPPKINENAIATFFRPESILTDYLKQTIGELAIAKKQKQEHTQKQS